MSNGENEFVFLTNDVVVFPSITESISINDKELMETLKLAKDTGKYIFSVAVDYVENIDEDNRASDEGDDFNIYSIGTICKINKLVDMPDGSTSVFLEGIERAKIKEFIEGEGEDEAVIVQTEKITEGATTASDKELEALVDSVEKFFKDYVKPNNAVSSKVLERIKKTSDPSQLLYIAASYLDFPVGQKQEILESLIVTDQLEQLHDIIKGILEELDKEEIDKDIEKQAEAQMDKNQREYYLQEKLIAVQKELGYDSQADEFAKFEKNIEETEFSEEAKKVANEQLKKLKSMAPQSE